jgi:hypothetical protein
MFLLLNPADLSDSDVTRYFGNAFVFEYITLLFLEDLELNAHFGILTLFGLSEEISVLEGEEYYMHALSEFEDLKYGTT